MLLPKEVCLHQSIVDSNDVFIITTIVKAKGLHASLRLCTPLFIVFLVWVIELSQSVNLLASLTF